MAHLDGCCGASALARRWFGGLAILEFQPGFLFWRPRYGSLAGHTGSIMAVVFSPDGQTALPGSVDHTLKLWDVATGKEIRSFAGHTELVSSVAFSPDGHTALSGSWDRTLKLWDLTARR